MNVLKLDALNIETMHSGRSCLNLTSCLTWEDFPSYAHSILDILAGHVAGKAEAVDIRIWQVIIKEEMFRLTFDDFPVMVSLESMTTRGDALIETFRSLLARPV